MITAYFQRTNWKPTWVQRCTDARLDNSNRTFLLAGFRRLSFSKKCLFFTQASGKLSVSYANADVLVGRFNYGQLLHDRSSQLLLFRCCNRIFRLIWWKVLNLRSWLPFESLGVDCMQWCFIRAIGLIMPTKKAILIGAGSVSRRHVNFISSSVTQIRHSSSIAS